jgi:hypothetical protein
MPKLVQGLSQVCYSPLWHCRPKRIACCAASGVRLPKSTGPPRCDWPTSGASALMPAGLSSPPTGSSGSSNIRARKKCLGPVWPGSQPMGPAAPPGTDLRLAHPLRLLVLHGGKENQLRSQAPERGRRAWHSGSLRFSHLRNCAQSNAEILSVKGACARPRDLPTGVPAFKSAIQVTWLPSTLANPASNCQRTSVFLPAWSLPCQFQHRERSFRAASLQFHALSTTSHMFPVRWLPNPFINQMTGLDDATGKGGAGMRPCGRTPVVMCSPTPRLSSLTSAAHSTGL